MRDRRASQVLLLGLFLFCSLVASAMVLYPGGSAVLGKTGRYHFWGNFFSELGFTTTVSGQENALCYWLFLLAMCTVGLFLLPTAWTAPPRLLQARTSIYCARILGILSCLGFILVGLIPYNENASGHMVGVVCGFIPWLLFAPVLLWDRHRSGEVIRPTWRWGLPLLIALHGAQGLWRMQTGRFTWDQPLVQKLVVLYLIVVLVESAVWVLRWMGDDNDSRYGPRENSGR
ncbi:MAG: hypothetical protein ACYTGH_07750 [Planctomycetota bacterium]|jgi:hypothetical protein